MSLNTALTLFLEEYPSAVNQQFAGNGVAEFIRREVPDVLRETIGDSERYIIQGSPGQGNWARVPWAAIYDRFVTETVQDGYYLVYLVKEDFTGVFLSLNQGVTTIRQQYGADAKKALQVRANDYLARLGDLPDNLISGRINLNVTSQANWGAYYEQGAICSKLYERDAIPTDDELKSDLNLFLDYYFNLAARETILFDQSHKEQDEEYLGWEDLRVLRTHKRIERNQKLAQKAKKFLGLKCQACDFNFEEVYGELGKDYIEAHHLTPLSQLQGKKIALDVRRDFAVLCSNCHRMIHRSEHVANVELFKKHLFHNNTADFIS
jgi:5-methylcytosine-specific restriction protein A